jgi:hypothetical protein
MNADLMITKELESSIFRWLTHEVVSLIQQSERRGDSGIKYLTRLKLQKLLFIVIEDSKLDLTRVWYMYGGIVCAPFDLHALSHAFYNKRESFSARELTSIETRLGSSKTKSIVDDLSEIFSQVFFKKTKDFLLDFYEDRAPKEFQNVYRTLRDYINLYTSMMSLERLFDVKSQKLLPSYDPWHQVHRLQGYLSGFHIESAKIVDKDILRNVVDFTDLMEKVVINLAWKSHQETAIDSKELQILLNLEKIFENTAWKLVANHIAIETVLGIRAEEVKTRFQEAQTEIMTNLATEIRNQTSLLKDNNLLPRGSVLKEYFGTKYGDMFKKVMGTEFSQ